MTRTTFYRPVRSYPDPLPTETIKVEAPPALPDKQGGSSSMTQLLYPLSGMLMSALFILPSLMGGREVNPLLMVGSIAFIPLSLGIMLLANFLQQRGSKQRVAAERAAYKNHLEDRERRLGAIATMQQRIGQRLYPDLPALLEVATQRNFLWERRPTDPDFLTVRVGLAPAPLSCKVEFQEDYRVNYNPELLLAARDLTSRKRYLDQLPVTIPLPRLGTVAVRGSRAQTHELTRFLLCQLAAFHSPNEVRVLAYFPSATTDAWNWLKWLPHTRRLHQIKSERLDGSEQLCMLASTVEDFQEILQAQIKPEIERRNKMNLDQRAQAKSNHLHTPHLFVVLDGFEPRSALANVSGLEDLLLNSARLSATVLCLVEHAHQEPATIQARLLLNTVAGTTQLQYTETVAGGADIEFVQPDRADISTSEQIARSLAPLKLIDNEAELDFSQDIRLLTLQNLPSVDSLNVLEHWRSYSEAQLLSVPIGQQKHGPLLLDLKEMAAGGFGPHGMVVGGTGSGKSELLRTVVTSLALTHDPYTVNFVLVDFKAGAAFADFEDLPHLAGMITNLENDPLQINRMYASLLGEQQRRQTMLSNAGNLSNIGQYHARRRQSPSMEPMPYLLIIVDEFAQLIGAHEEFLALFTKFGQVGRSLGMHMMLATQRVDEGRIRSLDGHLRYRICLRTFKPEESSAVIGTADAYYLPPLPGSGYFKVDEDLYTSFKTALISTPYQPLDTKQVDPVTLIREFTPAGQLLPTQQKAAGLATTVKSDPPSEMAMVVRRIKQVPSPAGGWRVHAVWQPPLKTMMTLEEVLQRCNQPYLDGSAWFSTPPFGPLTLPIGLLDRPATQTQEPVMLDFAGIGGHLAAVGAPQSGKSTLLRTIMASFLITHTPKEVQLYAIDLGGGLLRVFDGAPHVGAVCGKTERDKIRRVIRRIRQVLVEREQLFSEKNIDSMATYRQLRREQKLPGEVFGDVFLFIDNYGLLQNDFENSDPDIITDIATLIANGLTYGVHVILTANQWLEIRTRQRSNIGTRLELRLNDPSESEIDRRQAMTIPVEAPGRGLHQSKLLFQTAFPVATTSDNATAQPLETLVQRVRESWKGQRAPQVQTLPVEVSWETMPVSPSSAGVPVGLEEFNLGPLLIDLINSDPHFLILGDRECGKTTLLRTWIRGIERCYTPEQVKIILVDYKRNLLAMSKSTHVSHYIFMADQLKAAVQDLKKELEQRIADSQSLSLEQLNTPQPWQGTHYVILVDDYETVATPDVRMGNPLNPLEGFMQSARDIGFHLVLARRVVNMGQTTMDPTFRSIKSMESPGLLMRGDPVEGRQALHKQSTSDALPAGRGLFVRRGYPPTLVQVAS
jgi:S-DNA-T family DNA segregation ATPase FtsK/SpoIIIE